MSANYFKTSYVTVYPGGIDALESVEAHFKTSYVTVYLYLPTQQRFLPIISKHRMLLFIQRFQCFLCSFLRISKHRMLLFIENDNTNGFGGNYFKTSYVTFYPRSSGHLSGTFLISKHRMLLFILCK